MPPRPPSRRRRIDVGARIFGAVEATFARVGQNTNLGIMLLCAPLAQAALDFPERGSARGRRRACSRVSTRADADLAFKAIARANPAGLGAAPRHDVTEPARATLLEAMRASRGPRPHRLAIRPRFRGYFRPRPLDASRRRGEQGRGKDAGDARGLSRLSRRLSRQPYRRANSAPTPASACLGRGAGLRGGGSTRDNAKRRRCAARAVDGTRSLKERGLNPGTSADLTVATLFADYVAGASWQTPAKMVESAPRGMVSRAIGSAGWALAPGRHDDKGGGPNALRDHGTQTVFSKGNAHGFDQQAAGRRVAGRRRQ